MCGFQSISINNSSCKLKNIKALLAKKNEEMITMEATNSNIARILIGHENHYSLQDNFKDLRQTLCSYLPLPSRCVCVKVKVI